MRWTNKGHQYDDIGYILQEKKNIYIYGAGGNAREILNIIENSRQYIKWDVYFIDRDVVKQKEGIEGYKVLSPSEFFSRKKEDYFVVVAPEGKIGKEINGILKDAGVDESIIFDGFYFLHYYISIYFAYVHDIVFFSSQNVLPTSVCNLNCRDCLNFTPYIKNHKKYSLDSLKEMIDVYFGVVDYIYRFQITGGEPLLYTHLVELLSYIHEKYREKIIRLELVTNGTVIPSDELCEFLHDKHIYVFLDDYTMSLDEKKASIHEKVKEKLVSFDVDFVDNRVEQWIQMYTPDKNKYNEMTDEKSLEKKYISCNSPWSTFRDFKISSCNYANYASYAGILKEDDSEVYDFRNFTKDKKKELIEFRTGYSDNGYTKFCSMCNGWTQTNQYWCKPAIQVERDKYEME